MNPEQEEELKRVLALEIEDNSTVVHIYEHCNEGGHRCGHRSLINNDIDCLSCQHFLHGLTHNHQMHGPRSARNERLISVRERLKNKIKKKKAEELEAFELQHDDCKPADHKEQNEGFDSDEEQIVEITFKSKTLVSLLASFSDTDLSGKTNSDENLECSHNKVEKKRSKKRKQIKKNMNNKVFTSFQKNDFNVDHSNKNDSNILEKNHDKAHKESQNTATEINNAGNKKLSKKQLRKQKMKETAQNIDVNTKEVDTVDEGTISVKNEKLQHVNSILNDSSNTQLLKIDKDKDTISAKNEKLQHVNSTLNDSSNTQLLKLDKDNQNKKQSAANQELIILKQESSKSDVIDTVEKINMQTKTKNIKSKKNVGNSIDDTEKDKNKLSVNSKHTRLDKKENDVQQKKQLVENFNKHSYQNEFAAETNNISKGKMKHKHIKWNTEHDENSYPNKSEHCVNNSSKHKMKRKSLQFNLSDGTTSDESVNKDKKLSNTTNSKLQKKYQKIGTPNKKVSAVNQHLINSKQKMERDIVAENSALPDESEEKNKLKFRKKLKNIKVSKRSLKKAKNSTKNK